MRLNQASVIIERSGYFYGQCSELCLRLDRSICYGKELCSLIFPSTRFSINYDVDLYELNSKYTQIGFSKLLVLGAYVISINNKVKFVIYVINKIIVKLILFERSLTRNWDSSSYIPQKFYLMDNKNTYYISTQSSKWEINSETKNIFKQKNILFNEQIIRLIKIKVFWLTEIKSTIIQSTNWSKLGNPVSRKFLWFPVLKQHGSLQPNSKTWIEQLFMEFPGGRIGTKIIVRSIKRIYIEKTWI